MVISEPMAALLNQQVGHEIANRMLYRMFASYAHNLGLKNIEKFFTGESDGELGHSDKFVAYILESNSPLIVPAIEKKPHLNDCGEIANAYIQAEADTTAHIKAIWAQSVADNDIGTQDLLQFFLREQIEEEGLAERFGNAVDLANGNLPLLDLMIGEWA